MLRSTLIATPVLVGAGFFLLLAVAPARAQSTQWSDRALFSVNLGVQPIARRFDEQLTPVIYAERASIDVAHPGAGAKLTMDVAGGVRLWRNLGAGGAFTKFAPTETATVIAQIPHPTLFNQPRAASKAVPFQRSETAIHIQALYVMPITPRIDIALSAGPSMIDVKQDLVQSIEVTEVGPPFTSATIGNVALVAPTGWVLGVNAGADVTWFVTPIAGVGFTARYVSGSAWTMLTDGNKIDLKVGGFQVGFGARIRLR